MAIYHLSAQIISRGGGRSAVAAAAYRHATQMYAERTGQSFSYASKHDVAHTEIMLPAETPEWLRTAIDGRDTNGASEAIWNAVEVFEKRADAQLAREVEVALPVEFTAEENLETVREFARRFTDNGQIVDFAFHNKAGNPHVHIMLTMRPLTEDGFGKKKVPLRNESGEIIREGEGDKQRIKYRNFAGQKDTLLLEREAWGEIVNRRLALKGIEERIDHRSFDDRGLELEPTQHRGLFADAVKQKGIERASLTREQEIAATNEGILSARPELIWQAITDKKSVFDADDIAKALMTYVQEQDAFQNILTKLLVSDELLALASEVRDPVTGKTITKARYTTKDMVKLERGMADRALRMQVQGGFKVKAKTVAQAIKASTADKDFELSDQQKAAVEYITGQGRMASIIGLAGAGKSTLLKAARMAWEKQGYNVRGLSLAGKAVDELVKSSGIDSRTIASLAFMQSKGSGAFTGKDVIVIDEAGMVGSRQLAGLLKLAEDAGAKVVLVGDPDQLPAISAGAAMRAITERTGYSEISEIRRQGEAWMRGASLKFARGDVAGALADYRDNLMVAGFDLQSHAIDALARDFTQGHAAGELSLALAHSNKDVGKLNTAIRGVMKERGLITDEAIFEISVTEQNEETLRRRNFGIGDRIVFKQNDKQLCAGGGVKNGMLAKVLQTQDGKLSVEMEDGRVFSFSPERYNNFDHGFAVTVHKSQGATVDNVHVLATRSMTRNLAYVAMTRHQKSAQMYYGRKSFSADIFKGGIVEALSRPDTKATTLDFEGQALYDMAIRFGERRGLDTAQAIWTSLKVKLERLARKLGLVSKQIDAAKPEVVQQAKTAVQKARKAQPKAPDLWIVPPVLEFKLEENVAVWARARDLFSDRPVEDIRSRVSDIFKDPDGVMEKIFPFALDVELDVDTIPAFVAKLTEDRSQFVGSDKVFASKAEKEARRKAQAYTRLFGSDIKTWNQSVKRAFAEAQKLETEYRRRLGVGVPYLSRPAYGVLQEMSDSSERKIEKLIKAHPKESAEIYKAYKAFGQRAKGIKKLLRTEDILLDPAERLQKAGLLKYRAVLDMISKVGVDISMSRTFTRQINREHDIEWDR